MSCTTVSRWSNDLWGADYDSAEQRAARVSQPIMIAFFSGKMADDKQFRSTVLNDPEVRNESRRFVGCSLYQSSEADRRYARQFGVERGPALIVVHEDATYHALFRPSASQAHDFLRQSQAPGLSKSFDPMVARRVEYRWHNDFEAALQEADATDRRVFVVVYRSLTSDWHRMEAMLLRTDVHRALGDMIPCKLSYFQAWGERRSTPWGEVSLPAIVIVDGEKAPRCFAQPTSPEAIIRFATQPAEAPNSAAIPNP